MHTFQTSQLINVRDYINLLVILVSVYVVKYDLGTDPDYFSTLFKKSKQQRFKTSKKKFKKLI